MRLEEFCYHQKYNNDGGCNTFRTQQMEDMCAEKLNKKFPKYYTIDYSKTSTKRTIGKLRTRVMYSKAYKE